MVEGTSARWERGVLPASEMCKWVDGNSKWREKKMGNRVQEEGYGIGSEK